MRSTIGLSKAKRRDFKMAERRRIQELDANNERQEKKKVAQSHKTDDNDNVINILKQYCTCFY